MKSIWLEGRKERLEQYKNGVKKKANTIAIVMTVVVVALILATFIGVPEEGRVSASITIGFTYAVVLLITQVAPLKIKKLNLESLEGKLGGYLRTQEDVEAFERELVAPPQAEIEVGGGLSHRKIRITANWVVVEDVNYIVDDSVFKREEVGYIHGTRIDRTAFTLYLGIDDQVGLAYFATLDKKDYFRLLQFAIDQFPGAHWQAYTKGMPQKKVS